MAYSKARRLADIVVDTNGNINVPTQSASDNDTSAASTAYVTTAVSGLIDSAPDTLNTLNEIAAALNDDANFNTTVTNAIASKFPLAGGTMTGDLRVGTADAANRTITVAGGATGNNEGGEIRLEMAADHDGTYNFWRLDVNQDDFRIGREGLTDLLVDSSGKVGIGTTSPSTLLHLNAASYPKLTLSDETGVARAYSLGTSNETFIIRNETGTTDVLSITNGNKVGIGTTSPGALLDLSGVTASSPPKLRLSGTGEGSAGDTIGQIDFHSGDTTDNTAGIMASIKAIAGPSGGEGHLQFLTDMPSEGAAAATVALHLNANANVGIGSTSPAEKLHVVGDVRIDDDLHIQPTKKFYLDGGNDTYITEVAANQMAFNTAGGERVRINTSGKVGIKSTDPQKNLSIGSSQGEGIQFNYDSTNNYRNQILNYWNTNTDSRMDFNIARTGGETPATIMSVGYSSNVGIGTTAPTSKLHVAHGNQALGFDSGIFSSANPSNYTVGRGAGITMQNADVYTGGIYGIREANNWTGALAFYTHTSSSGNTFGTTFTEKMRIASDGETTINQNLRIANGGTATAGTVALEILGQRNDTITPANATAKFYGYSDGDGLAIGHYLSAPYGSYLQAGYLLDTYGTPYNNGYPITLNPKGGNVGIANSNPTSLLHLGSNSASSELGIGLQNSSRYYVIKTSSGDLVFKDESAAADRMVLESNGNLIVGASSGSAEGGKIQIFGAKSFVAQIPQGNMTITDTASMAAGVGGSINFAGAYLSNGTTTSFASIEASKADGTSGNYGGELKFKCRINGGQQDEFMRLTSNGTLHVDNGLGAHSGTYSFAHNTYNHAAVFGRNSTPDGTVVIEDYDVSSGIGNTVLKCFLRDQDPATSATFINFGDGGGSVGSITHKDDGSGVNYNTSSDYRLKENVEYNWDATTLLKQLKPARFNFIKKPGKTVQGFLAHEVSDIVPGSVRGDKDHMMEIGTIKDSDDNIVYEGVYEHFCKTDEGQTWTKTGTEPFYQELDYSKLVPLLVKTIQEQQTVIEDLKSRIETLEG